MADSIINELVATTTPLSSDIVPMARGAADMTKVTIGAIISTLFAKTGAFVTGLNNPADSTVIAMSTSVTFAQLVTLLAAGFVGTAFVTDVARGSLWVSDGIRIYPQGGSVVLARTALPVILPSSGSVGNNGALTLTTALPRIYGKCYMYFKAGALYSGSAAGIYYVVMSSTTVGVVYNNVYTTGPTFAPVTPTAFVTTGPGAYTQLISTSISLFNALVPAKSLGLTGGIECFYAVSHSNSANDKYLNIRYDTAEFSSMYATTTLTHMLRAGFNNAGVANIQRCTSYDGNAGYQQGAATALHVDLAVDSTLDKSLTFIGWMANALDFIVLETMTINLLG